MRDLRCIVVDDIEVVWVPGCIVLVVALRSIECLQRNDLSDDLVREAVRLLELCDIGLRDQLLSIVAVENG